MAQGTKGDLGAFEVMLCLVVTDDFSYLSTSDTRNEVADVLVAGEGRHGAKIGTLSSLVSLKVTLIFIELFEFLVVCAAPCANAARDGGVIGGTVWVLRLGLFGLGFFSCEFLLGFSH